MRLDTTSATLQRIYLILGLKTQSTHSPLVHHPFGTHKVVIIRFSVQLHEASCSFDCPTPRPIRCGNSFCVLVFEASFCVKRRPQSFKRSVAGVITTLHETWTKWAGNGDSDRIGANTILTGNNVEDVVTPVICVRPWGIAQFDVVKSSHEYQFPIFAGLA
jgi:hypothetical protein